ncbi:MAG: hypothetical protein KAI24_11250 [Planctomycetes bacterium]|nr:hypothetical protein [Planctomycetota bacterium]
MPRLPSILLAIAATSALGSAQAPAVSTRTAVGVCEVDGVVTGVARGYRVTFGARGATYRPALGKRAPRAHAFGLELHDVARGPTIALRADRHSPTVTHTRTTASYAWPEVVEHYETRRDALKHGFTFAQPPAGRGDLTVTLDLTTELVPDADLHRWLDDDGFGVSLGEVVGIDASGRRCAGSKRLVDDRLELRLPASFVDTARYPLVLDPLIGTVTQGFAGTDNDFPDVAYDAGSDTWCVVWTQFLGGGQTGVVGSVWLASPLGFGYAFAINGGDADGIRVTNIAGLGVFVLVWVEYTQNGNYIQGLALEPVQGQASNVFPIDGPYDVGSPVVSGEATVLDDDCLVAWLDSSLGLLGTSVTIDAQLQATVAPFVQIATGDVYEPAISKQGGSIGHHVITWTHRPLGLPGAIRAQVVDHDMNLLGPAAWIRNAPQNAGWPAVDGDGLRFFVAWEEQEVLSPATTDVRGKLITVGAAGITSVGGELDLAAVPGQIDYAADVALLGDRFGLAFMRADPNAIFDDDSFALVLDPAGAPVGAELPLDLTPGLNYTYEHAPRLIGRRAGDPATASDDGLIVFADQDTAATYDSDVGLQGIEAMGPGGAIVDLGGGCGPGGLAASGGPFALGNGAAPLELFGAQPLAVPFVLVGTAGARVSCGVCDFVDPSNAWFVPNTAGTAATSIAIPGTPALVGFAFDFQFVSLNVLYVGCPALPGVAASNIVRATLGL